MSDPTDCSTILSQADDWIDNLLPHTTKQMIAGHLPSCSSCSTHYLELKAQMGIMSQLAAPKDLRAVQPWLHVAYSSQLHTWKVRSRYQSLISKVVDQAEGRQIALIESHTELRTTGFCKFLVDESLYLVREDPPRAKALGEIAVLVCQVMRRMSPGEKEGPCLHVSSLIQLADVLRISGDLVGAGACFKSAEVIIRSEHLTRTIVGGEYLRFLGHQRASQRRFSEAASTFDKSVAVFKDLGELRMAGRSTADKGTQMGESGALSRSLELLESGGALMRQAEPRIKDILAMKHNTLVSLVEMGRVEEATQLLPEVRTLHTERQQPDLLLRLQWVESQLALACQDFRLAESLLLSVKAGFLDFDMPYDVALASLHLAVLYMEEGRWSEIPPLISEMLTVFQALRIDREAIAAVLILKRAMDIERLSLALLREAVSYFRRAQEDPGVRFLPSRR